MPLSGILLSQSAGFPVSPFGLFVLPGVFPADIAIPVMQRSGVKLGFLLHSTILAYALYVILVLHVAGLLKHHLIDRDRSIWQRMASWTSGEEPEANPHH